MSSVSVFIPTYNRCEYLKQAIESVLGQTYSDFNIHVVDNASTDNTEQLVKSFSGIHYHRNPANVGMVENVRRCFSLCDSDYWMIMADDDLLTPTHLETALSGLKNYPQAALFGSVSCLRFTNLRRTDYYRSLVPADIRSQFTYLGPETFLAHAFYYTPIFFPGTVGRRQVATLLAKLEIPEGINALMDRYFWTSAMELGGVVTSPLPTLFYREHPQQEITKAMTNDDAYAEEHLICARHTVEMARRLGVSLKEAIGRQSEILTEDENRSLLKSSQGSWRASEFGDLSQVVIEKAPPDNARIPQRLRAVLRMN